MIEIDRKLITRGRNDRHAGRSTSHKEKYYKSDDSLETNKQNQYDSTFCQQSRHAKAIPIETYAPIENAEDIIKDHIIYGKLQQGVHLSFNFVNVVHVYTSVTHASIAVTQSIDVVFLITATTQYCYTDGTGQFTTSLTAEWKGILEAASGRPTFNLGLDNWQSQDRQLLNNQLEISLTIGVPRIFY